MEFRFFCPACGQKLKAEAEDAGRRVDCPHCAVEFRVPFPEGKASSSSSPNHTDPPRESAASRNETDISWTSDLTSETATPIASRGIDAKGNALGLTTFFKNIADNTVYIAFCVYEDSFPAFIQAKQAAADAGLAFGWEPFLIADGPVVFGAIGHTPKPQ